MCTDQAAGPVARMAGGVGRWRDGAGTGLHERHRQILPQLYRPLRRTAGRPRGNST